MKILKKIEKFVLLMVLCFSFLFTIQSINLIINKDKWFYYQKMINHTVNFCLSSNVSNEECYFYFKELEFACNYFFPFEDIFLFVDHPCKSLRDTYRKVEERKKILQNKIKEKQNQKESWQIIKSIVN